MGTGRGEQRTGVERWVWGLERGVMEVWVGEGGDGGWRLGEGGVGVLRDGAFNSAQKLRQHSIDRSDQDVISA